MLRHTCRFEFKANHGEWINNTKPNLGPGLSERVAEALRATDENMNCYLAFRTELQAAMNALLEVILVLMEGLQLHLFQHYYPFSVFFLTLDVSVSAFSLKLNLFSV